MFKVMMIVDGQNYLYGSYEDCDRANEIALQVRAERNVETFVEDTNNPQSEDYVTDFDEIVEAYEKAIQMPRFTSERKVRPNHIFDADKSVNWNIEECARHNMAIDIKNKELIEARYKATEFAFNSFCNYVSKEYGVKYCVARNLVKYIMEEVCDTNNLVTVDEYVGHICDIFKDEK